MSARQKLPPLLAALFLLSSGALTAGEPPFELGARGGITLDAAQDIRQIEVFANRDLPWGWKLGSRWRLQSRLDVSAGWLGANHDMAFVGSISPTLVLGRERLPFTLEVGLGPTVISRHNFEHKHVGSWYQFTSHAGVNLDLGPRFRLGYRWQHMSNGGLAKPNPGINLHMVAFSYRF